MDNATLTFHRLRPRLQGIAYRMLGSLAEAEEVVQDVWLRWNDAARDALDNPDGWLVTVTTRLAIARHLSSWLPRCPLCHRKRSSGTRRRCRRRRRPK